MQNFLKDFRFIIFFLVLSLGVGTLGGEELLYYFLLLTFVSMLILNADKLSALQVFTQ